MLFCYAFIRCDALTMRKQLYLTSNNYNTTTTATNDNNHNHSEFLKIIIYLFQFIFDTYLVPFSRVCEGDMEEYMNIFTVDPRSSDSGCFFKENGCKIDQRRESTSNRRCICILFNPCPQSDQGLDPFTNHVSEPH